MKHFILLISSIIITQLSYSQEKREVSSDIKQVTVFQNKAQLVNTATTTVDAGITEVVVGGLSQFVEQNSVQVSGKGDFIIMGVKQKVNYINHAKKTPEYLALEDTTDKLKMALEHLKDKKFVYEKEEEMLMMNLQVNGKEKSLTADEYEDHVDFVRDRLLEIRTQKAKNERELIKKKEAYTEFKNQLNTLKKNFEKPTTEVIITVSAKNRVTIGLEITYIVNNAGWTPVYDLRCKNTSSPMQLIYKANVYQNTGVDWERVKFKLSTGNPNAGGVKPELNSWYLDIEQPITHGKKSVQYDMAAPLMMERKADSEENEIKTEDATSNTFAYTTSALTVSTENTINVDFDVAVPYSVASDGNNVLMDVQTYQVPVQFKHLTAPKLDESAYLTALFTNWEQYNLLPGEANVYFEGTFVGNTYLNPDKAVDTIPVSLGQDKKIIVKREVITDFTSKKMIGSNKKVEYAYSITIKNAKKDTANVVIEDQIPVSKNSDIEIETIELGGAELNKETGKLTWRGSMNAGDEKKIIFRFTVKHPKGKNISGL